ncbi:ABC transporter substrate-binding protein [Phascolarctobacterium succinatutens]|uniref:ABC transporter substrate-binding protein n=1 Tax=Phascolarctobacterium succinatutens TaxID=626940 RepID=UPI0040284E55
MNVVILAAYRHLAPGNKDGLYCSRVLGVWEPLVTKDADNRPAPCLAQSWEMRDGGKEWIFHLRENVYFHNGSRFTADSVIANFDRMKKGYKRSSFYGLNMETYYPTLLKYEKLDDYTVRLLFKEANVNELYKMTDFGSPIYAPECFAEDGNFKSVAIGTGPYRITENALNKYVVLQRNENYWGEKARINKYIVRTIPNTDTRYAALKSGEIDGVIDINAIPPFLAEEIKKDPRFEVGKNKSTMIRYLGLNGTKFPFNDVRMRRAVSLAIDRKNLVHNMYLDYAEPTVNILNYTSPGYKALPVTYDLQEAKRLAHEVLGDKRCEITYCINGSEPLQKGEAELIAYWLQEIGLDVKIKSIEYATLSKMLRKGDFNIVRIQRGLANGDPFSALYPFVMPDGALNVSNRFGYNNTEVIMLMNNVKHITDEQERQRVFDRVQEIVAYEQPVIPLFNDMNIVAYNKRLKNYKPLIYGIDLSRVELAENND